MYYLVSNLCKLFVVLLLIGFFSPRISLFWYKRERTRKMSLFVYIPLIFIFGFFSIQTQPKELTEKLKKENLEEEKRLSEKREERERKREERERNKVYEIEDVNDFKDHTKNYIGKKIEGVFYFSSQNKYSLKGLLDFAKNNTNEKFVTVFFYMVDTKGSVTIRMELPVELTVPNITNNNEEVKINFTCNNGDIDSGNIINSIYRPK